MAAWRFVAGVPALHVQKGAVKELPNSYLKTMAQQDGRPWWMFALPAGLGLHFSEKEWPALLEIQPTLGRSFDAEAVDPEKVQAAQARLSELSAERGRILAGLDEVQRKLEDLELRTAITGLSAEDYTNSKLWCHHRAEWRRKLVQVEGELAGVARTVEHLLSDQAFAQRHHAAQVVLEGEQPNPEALVSPEDLRAALLRAACTVVQFEGLLTLLSEENSPVPRYCFPEAGHDALQTLRRDLLAWMARTGRAGLSLRQLLGEVDVRELLERAEQLVDQAREQHIEEVGEPAGLVVA